ncbi:SGNH/GDSL hydrolase family protein [Pseudonocardia sp.]|uniref:SGNH/GDSL hydrolase family protein n=1 Tax=Pseudonocardia sp. TaxID=60912 RepID=UPI003D0C4825
MTISAAPPALAVRTLVTLGDSTPAGLGDPLPDGRWRGFPALLGDALGARVVNTARTGARMGCVRREQLPVALGSLRAGEPSVAVVFAGMNDTLRSDFDPAALRADCAAVVAELRAAGAHVLLVRYHDHTRVFRLPGPLRRALRRRIAALNSVVDSVVDSVIDSVVDSRSAGAAPGVGVLDLDTVPGCYDRSVWSVDRLHPSELGHRLLAAGLAGLVADAGYAAAGPVSLVCGGGRRVTRADRAVWLVVRGVPWLVRRGRDLGPVIAQGLLDGLRRPPEGPAAMAPCAVRHGATGPGGDGAPV